LTRFKKSEGDEKLVCGHSGEDNHSLRGDVDQCRSEATVAVEGELFPLAPYDVWCIAGERFWVGYKNRGIMTGTAQASTTSLVQSPRSKVQGHSLDLGP